MERKYLNMDLKTVFPEDRMAALAVMMLELADDEAVGSEAPDIGRYAGNLVRSLVEGRDQQAGEQALVDLYARLHVTGSSYSPRERELLNRKGGYSSYPGGLSPLLPAGAYIKPESIVADLGAGNGLQGLMLQRLYPHRRTLQVELCAEMVRVGRVFQRALGIDGDRVEWIHDDIANAPIEAADFIYIYRPARPSDGGREIYRSVARRLSAVRKPLVIFSVADCLGEFLDERFSVSYADGNLTCFVRE